MSRSLGSVAGAAYLASALTASYIILGSPSGIGSPGVFDLPLLLLVGLHYLWGVVQLFLSVKLPGDLRGEVRLRRVRCALFFPQLLLALSLVYFLFSYIYALNANMDYVQRFISSGGELRLAPDTRAERLLVVVRLAPLILVNLAFYAAARVGHLRLTSHAVAPRGSPAGGSLVAAWGFIWAIISALVRAVAAPSFAGLAGIGALGWVAFVPLFLLLRRVRVGHGVFLGVLHGALTTLLASYWLGTFNLVSLQITVLLFTLYYSILIPVTMLLYRAVSSSRIGRVLIFPLAFAIFEYLHSIGFLGYPWGLAGHTQYGFTSLIQVASLTGVWGVSFLLLLANSLIAELLDGLKWRRRSCSLRAVLRSSWRARWALGAAAFFGVIVFGGALALADEETDRTDAERMRVALIQQSTDPRKSEYERTLDTLIDLTERAIEDSPHLIVWSETAFVPNIRRWSQDESNRRYYGLVERFLEFQRGTRRWLITGNDDYELITDESGEIVERNEYNATVLFSPTGGRMQTYRKIRLVPFTEYFPYREQFPGIYDLLQQFDVHFWYPGVERTVFEHPMLSFITPICYEDVFPNHVREFVNAGAQAIINVSNDYWSLNPVQAKQHFVASLFRAVENRRPLLRSTASGLTGYVSAGGRIIETLPYYEAAQTVVELEYEREPPTTFYGTHGDWFPVLLMILLPLLVAGVGVKAVAVRRARRATDDGGTIARRRSG